MLRRHARTRGDPSLPPQNHSTASSLALHLPSWVTSPAMAQAWHSRVFETIAADSRRQPVALVGAPDYVTGKDTCRERPCGLAVW
ncbi:MAG TPA: hypothetical protein VHM94_03955, partial [Acidimicrobiia bacterium]|nr:hypothetical protein [Acidimicrobiia bacterium]